MELLSIISPPLVGGVIGYITNYLAIKMLFRPLKPVMIGRFRVPFTPGIVPKRKDALAAALGNAIVEKFFNADDLEIVFTSDYFRNAVAEGIVELLYSKDVTLRKLGKELQGQAELAKRAEEAVCVRIRDALLESDLPELIVTEGDRMLQKRFGRSALGKAAAKSAMSSLSESLKEEIRAYLAKDGLSVIRPFVKDMLADLARKPVGQVTEDILPDKETVYRIICGAYSEFMRTRVRSIAESIDVGKIITQKVVLMDPGEIEALVLAVVNRELRYVIWLGALLGVLIGAVNIFI
jgi:uncharacterized membrane protein YheB (UPF0754 family)